MDLSTRAPYRPPAFPTEPPAVGRSWIKWAVIAVLLIAVAAGVLLAQKLGKFSHSPNMASPVPSGQAGMAITDKNAISQEDKARADALVGPQNRDIPAAQDAAAPANSDTAPAAVPAPQSAPPQPEPLPRPTTAVAPVDAAQSPLQAAPPPSRPTTQPKPNPRPQNRPQPTLDDLLD